MTTVKTLLLSAALLGTTTFAHAGDVRPDHIPQLLESGTIKPFDQLNAAATNLQPGSEIRETELEKKHDQYIYDVELKSTDGKRWDVKLDAGTGAVLSDREDD